MNENVLTIIILAAMGLPVMFMLIWWLDHDPAAKESEARLQADQRAERVQEGIRDAGTLI